MKSEIYSKLEMLIHLDKIFDSVTNELTSFWGDDDIPLTIYASKIALTLVEKWDCIENEARINVFSYIEEFLNDDSNLLQEIICTGFLERLMNDASAERIDFYLLAEYLGDKSLAYCRAYNEFTGNFQHMPIVVSQNENQND